MKELLLAVALLGQGVSSISGIILSVDGMPAANMRVGAVAVSTTTSQQGADSAILSVTQTDSNGRYRLENVPPGRYYVTAGLVNSPTYFPGVLAPNSATIVLVSEGAAITGMDFSYVAPFVPRPPQPATLAVPLVLRTVYLANVTTAQGINDIVTAVRAKVTLRRIWASSQAQAIILRDTAENVAAAEKLIMDMDKSGGGLASFLAMLPTTTIGTDIAGNLSVIEGGRANRVITGPQLQLRRTDPISIKMNGNVRALFETLGEMAGINVIPDRDLPLGPTVAFAVDNVAILDALDLLSTQTGSFWQVLNGNTILVAPETVVKHREWDAQIVKTIYLTNTPTSQGINDVVNATRAIVSVSYIAANVPANAIVLFDTPNRVALAEKVIADLDRPTGIVSSLLPSQTPPFTVVGTNSPNTFNNAFVLDAGRVRDVTPKRAMLQIKVPGPISLKVNNSVRAVYETLAGIAGLNILFDRDFSLAPTSSVAFRVENVDTLDALDFLSIQTNSFWIALDSKTILVAPQSTVKYRDLGTQILTTITLIHATTAQEIQDIVTAARILFSLSFIAAYPPANAIVMRDTPARLLLAEKVIADLDRMKGSGSSATAPRDSSVTGMWMTSIVNTDRVFFVESDGVRNVTPKRAQIQANATGPISVKMNEDARVSYETLARMAGITVTFDLRFAPGQPRPFNAENIDVLDALDYLSLQTGNFWKVVDSKTILVAPENAQLRRELEPQVSKTFTLTNAWAQQGVNDIITVARTLLGFGLIGSNAAGGIDITDTPSRLALAEKIIRDLDKPAPVR